MNRTLVAMLAVSALSIHTVAAQTGEDALRLARRQPLSSPGVSAMAGSGHAGLGSFSDLFLNPAGLGLMTESSFSAGFTALSATDDGLFSAGATGLSTNRSRTVLNHLAWTYRFPTARGSLVLGAGYSSRSRYDRELAYDGLNPSNSITDYFMPVPGEFELVDDGQGVYPDFNRTLSFIAFETYAIDLDPDRVAAGDPVPFVPAVSAGTVSQTGTVRDAGGISELSFGAAFEAARGVLVGASVNVPFGSYEFLRIHEEVDVDNDNDGTGGTTDFESLRLVETFTSHVAGVNLRAGLSARLHAGLRLGISVESPTALAVDEDYDTLLSTAFDNGDRFEYGSGVDDDAGRGRFEYDITTPWRVALGLAWEQGPAAVFADATFVDWSALELDSETVAFVEENIEIRRTMESTVALSVGGSYRLSDLTLRGGFGIDPDSRIAAERTVDRGRTYLGAGASYRVGRQLALELGWVMERFDDTFAPYVEVDGAPLVTESITRHFVQLGLRMGF